MLNWCSSLLCLTLLLSSAAAAPANRRPNRDGSSHIDEKGVLQFQGRPFFPIGIYHVDHTYAEYRMLAGNGFNMIQGMFPGDHREFMKSLDEALAAGLAVDVPLDINEKVKDNLANSLTIISEAKNHPAVLSWKILDEPEADRNSAVRAQVPDAFSKLKAAFPEETFELTLCQDSTLAYWCRYCDLVQIDRYPVPSKPLTAVYDFSRNAVEVMGRLQPLVVVLQSGWTADLKTQPTFDQARAMVYLALIGGAKGISWYSRQEVDRATGSRVWDLTTSPLWPRMKEINMELRSLASPVLLGEDVVGIKSNTPGLYFSAKRWQGRIHLLVCNPADNPLEASLSFPKELQVESIRGTGLKGRYSMDGARIRMVLEPMDSGTLVADIEASSGSQTKNTAEETDHPTAFQR